MLPSIPLKTMIAGLAAALVAVLWWRGEYYARRAETNASLLAGAIAANEQNVRLAKEQAEIHARLSARISANVARSAELRAGADKERKAITDAPPEDDGPLAAVLRRELDRLLDANPADPSRYASSPGDPGLSAGEQSWPL